jgi:hypothetical protein
MSNIGAWIIAIAIFFGCWVLSNGLVSVANSIEFAAKMYVRK